MMRLLLVVAFQAYVVASAGDATLLVQTPVAPAPVVAAQGETHENEKTTEKMEDLAKEDNSVVSDLLSKPESVFKAMTEQVSSLESEIDKQRKQGQAALQNQQATFESKLTEQQNANVELEKNIEGVNSENSKLTTTNRQLWQRSKELQNENEQHRRELQDIRAHIADAAEFVDLQMKEFADVDAKEEKVIVELDALEGEEEDSKTHKNAMSKIASFGKSISSTLAQKVSMLASDQNSDPVSILKIMEDTAANLNAEQKASEVQLREIFKKKFEVEATKRARLLDEQDKANQKRETLTAVFNRLTVAVKHLEDVSDGLKQGILSLGAFSEKIGREHIEKQAAGEKMVSLSEQGPSTFGKSHSKAKGSAGVEGKKSWISWLKNQ